jgi:iron complex outermembrane receptor protein
MELITMKTTLQLIKFITPVLTILISAAPVFAQDESVGEEALTLEEVVITAQKREQTLQEVPVSVTAFSGDYLDKRGVVDVRDLTAETPGFSMGSSDTESALFIRGIGSVAPGIGADPAVGIFIDGVPSSRGTNVTSAFFDVERIEVVKGPQGTLFGRNASAGAISIITNKPNLDENAGQVMLGVGDEGQFRGRFVGNLALNDRFALRAGVNHDQRDGLHYNSNTGEQLLDRHSTVVRLSALGLVTDSWETILMVEGLNFKSYDAIVNNDDAFADVISQNERPRKAEQDSFRFTWTNNWDLPRDMSLTSITGYYDLDVWVQPVDADEIDFPIATFIEPQTNKTFSQEFRLNGSADRVDWFVGASYVEEDLAFTTDLNYEEGIVLDLLAGAGFLCDIPELPECTYQSETPFGKNTVKSYAVYGDFTFHINDRWSLTAGARYTDDKKDMFYNNPATDGVLGVIDGQIFGPITDGNVYASDSWSSFDPRVAVDFVATESTTVFANIAKGYKSGGLNRQVNDFLPAMQVLNPFEEENVIAYEVGTKSRFMDGRATLNVSAYLNDYEDFQLETLVGLVPEIFNVGDLETKGIELEGRILVTEQFELAATYAYLNSKVKDSIDPSIIGNNTPQAPKNSGSISAIYYILMGAGEWALSGVWAFSDDYWFDIFNTLEQPSYNVLNLRLGYEANSGRWGVAAFADNVTDEEYYASRFVFLDVANRRAPGRLMRVEFTAYF